MEIWTGFLVGLFGSLHCVGMCGPIALALPSFSDSKSHLIFGRLLYNLGRVITYSVMGFLFGLLGNRVVLFGLQQDVSIGLGVLILVYLLTPKKLKAKISELKFYQLIIKFIKENFAKLISRRTNNSLFTIGLLNGILPCGFVYIGIAGAVSTGDAVKGLFYMALFGLGTTPIMFLTSIIGRILTFNLRSKINKLIPALTFLIALLFIIRGLNLGIPYISPKFEYPKANQINQEVDCCH
ncbi:MAG: sulfite exporter TauE/SafE family protein [Melioribacteraceae bacterium]|nr:sulfite exporter TauE/SafE family protein [Melioribacteraceae bacterium]